ncbi:MAG: hypothetical protein IKO75_14190 [Bacteroidales bacterium]|nr:hypothetical protein [Bacteroidales bacterium]
MKRYLIILVTILSAVCTFAQTAIGEFRSHVSMNSFLSVAADDETVYAASNNGLFLLDKTTIYDADPEFSIWTKVEGLSDIDIVKIHCDRENNVMIICYDNGNIDVIRNDKLVNIRDVKDKSMSGSKRLKNCRTFGNIAYLVYPFGIVMIDLDKLVISDTWFTKRENQVVPTDVLIWNQQCYVSTEEGLFSMSVSSPMISDFSQWEKLKPWNVSQLVQTSGRLFVVKEHVAEIQGSQDSLFVMSPDGWTFTGKTSSSIPYLTNQGDTTVVCYWDGVELLDVDAERLYYSSWYEAGYYPNAREGILDGQNIWVADHSYGLVQINIPYFSRRFFKAPGPYADYVEGLAAQNGVVAAVHGSRKGSTAFSPAYHHPAVSWFQNQTWAYNSEDFLTYDTNMRTYDLTTIAINPLDETEWSVASWGNGIFKCKNHQVVAHYNAANSLLDSVSDGKTFVSGLQYDSKGNLWMTNSYSNKMLKMLEPKGTWHAYNITVGVVSNNVNEVVAEQLLVDSHGYKWVNFPRDATYNRYHLIAFSDNGTYDNYGDDRLARIDMNVAAEVSSSSVYCMAEDLDGEIWIGTDKGVKVIYYPEKVFTGNSYPRNILLEQDGYVSVLFEYEQVTAIAVDGANRKWIGTSKAGVFLMSENGQEQLLHFTAEDNPLFSNQIESICIDQLSGEVFFATAKGLVSYRSTATAGFETYEENLVYPNPVPHGYAGMVAVSGLKSNSLCKITDSAGRLVWQGYSHGGQLVWDGKDHYGNRPATGVYYVMVSDEDGKEKIVTKFVFIN